MLKHARWIGAGTAVLALGIALLTTGAPGQAANMAELKTGLPQLAEAIEKKMLAADIDKLVANLAKDTDKGDLMVLFNPRNNKKDPGLGVGPNAGVVKPDGIEDKIKIMAKVPINSFTLNKEADALTKMAYLTAAAAKVTKELAPAKDVGMRKRADWLKWSQDMDDASMELAKALTAAKKDPKTVMNVAIKLDNACANCHAKFKVVGAGGN